MNTAPLDLPRPPEPAPRDAAAGWRDALAAALEAQDGPWVQVLAAGVVLDADDRRLLQLALTQHPELGAVSPADAASWRHGGGDGADLAWASAPRALLQATPDPRCSVWRREAAQAICRGATLPAAARALGLAVPMGGGAAVRDPEAATLAGRDGRPVVLHVLHAWGGGAWRFVDDQMRHDRGAHHLALVARGDRRGGWGRGWALHRRLDEAPIRAGAWEVPIADLVVTHAGERALLAGLIDDFGIAEIRISNLVGHSLDLLRSGLATRWVVHDLLPFWPVVDDPRAQPSFDEAALAAAAAAPGWPFSQGDPGQWRMLAEAAAVALCEADADVVAPSAFAKRRWQGLETTPDLPVRVQAHGLPPMAASRPPHRREGPLRVLVPGRLAGGKGEALLSALLDQGLDRAAIDWRFAGEGPQGARFAAAFGGEALGAYRPGTLPALVEAFDPDLALLPSTIPETFGYVLSEMTALGVGVLALRRGAYAERVGDAGLSEDAEALCSALRTLAAAPRRLPPDAMPSPPMDEALRGWPSASPRVPRWRRVEDPAALIAGLQHEHATMAGLASRLGDERDRAYRFYDDDTQDLIRQRDVAIRQAAHVSDELQEAREAGRQVAEALEQDLATQRQRVDEEARRRVALEREIAALRDGLVRLEAEQAALAAARSELESQAHALRLERDDAYGYYERDTADLIRQRDVAVAQRDALREQLERARQQMARRLVRWPLALAQWLADRRMLVAYHARRQAGLLRRGLRSLRHRGFRATWAAVQRRFASPRPTATADVTPDTALPAFPPVVQPVASIVIPVYGKLELTLDCLRSLAASDLPERTEVIVVDDASPDDSGHVLPTIPGLRYQRNASNLGFVGSCNAGAALARGTHLVFLNNDTTLRSGWLQALLGTFESHPDTGLVGAQLVYPDGRLQESGGIVFSDGSGWNYGRFEDPSHPSYTFVREVDYCSGAAIALPRALFERLGGFDRRYAPAYYEDTDLAMQVREAGLKVRVQPAAVVVHHEGATAGTDTGSGIKAYQVRNQQVFVDRWRDVLQRQHPRAAQDPRYAAQHQARARLLVIDATTPMPDRDSGSVRMFELLRLLVEDGCAVTFFPENGLDDGPYTAALRQLGVEAWAQPWLGGIPDWLARHGSRFQMVVVSRHYVLSPLLPLLRRHAPQARIVFDTVDLHHLREEREAGERGDESLARQAARTRDAELALVRAVDRTWVVSPFEKALLEREVPGAVVDVVSNIHRPRGLGPPRSQREGLLFVGGYRHPPNVDAALWLAREILPRVRAVRPEITLTLVGSDATDDVLALGGIDGVRVAGFVPDLTPLLDAHRVSVAPLRYGAGVKGKVNQALAHGLPVVATACAVEGMGLVHERDVLVGDDAEAIAASILRLYDDEALWQRLAEGGLANTLREFSPERARAALRPVFNDLR